MHTRRRTYRDGREGKRTGGGRDGRARADNDTTDRHSVSVVKVTTADHTTTIRPGTDGRAFSQKTKTKKRTKQNKKKFFWAAVALT